MKNRLYIENNQELGGCFIGWDYAHAGDYDGFYRGIETMEKETFGKKWTTQEIFEEVKSVCYQLEQLKENSPADKTFEELWRKKNGV